ncbi:major facilitator superfamily domain-containing protein [Limtongia smithiae]|uniref:major facilitator superfamily domain-containing protein n=1 Tax=Limtongia smithiae TaxID=1125753 RepID=UPI0034CD6A3D
MVEVDLERQQECTAATERATVTTMTDEEKVEDTTTTERGSDDVDVDPEARPAVFHSTFQEVVCIAVLALAPAMNSANQGSLLIVLPHVGEYFGIEGSQLSWILNSYSLVAGATMLIFARLSDMLGRKRALLTSFVWYAVFSLIEGFVKSDIVFDVLRGLQAFAGAAAAPAAVGILGVIYPEGRRKNRVVAMFAAGAPMGFVLGMTASGICTTFLGWKALLFFLAIVYGVLAVAGAFVIPSDATAFAVANRLVRAAGGKEIVPERRTWRTSMQLLRSLDFIGAGLSFVGLAMFVFALSASGGAAQGWRTPYVIGVLIAGVAIVGLFIVWEHYAKSPLMPMFIWRCPGFAVCMATVFCGWMVFQGGLLYFVPLAFQNIRKYTVLESVLHLLPQNLSGMLTCFVAANIMHVVPGRIIMVIAMVAFLIGALLWATQPYGMSYWAMTFPALIVVPIGCDLAYNVASQFAMSVVPPALKSTAGGVFVVMTQLAASVGVAASTAVVTSQIGNDITGQDAEVLFRGYRSAYWLSVGVAGAGVVLAVMMRGVGTQGAKK